MRKTIGCGLVSVCVSAALAAAGSPSVRPSDAPRAAQMQMAKAYGQLPLVFEPNRGQAEARVKWLARARGVTLFLTEQEAVLVLREPSAHALSSEPPGGLLSPDSFLRPGGRPPARAAAAASVTRMKLAGSSPWRTGEGLESTGGASNYFLGNDPDQWRTGIPHYRRVQFGAVYPGIDLVFYGTEGKLEYDLVVQPGADPGQIRLAFDGVDRLHVDAAGDLVLTTPSGAQLRQRRPRVYQEIRGRKVEVAGIYQILDQQQVVIHVAFFDATRPLVIDPVLAYSTYLGGSGREEAYGIAVDSSGAAYVSGQTASLNFPTQSPYQSDQGSVDAFVAKLNAAGNGLVYSTYLGGAAGDAASRIAIDTSGAAYVTGQTESTNFPTLSAFQNTHQGGVQDAFVTKLAPAGNALLYSTYLGGSGFDSAWAIAVDAAGSAYVTGFTISSNFPTLFAFQTFQGAGDAFVSKLVPAGSALAYSTYLGGSNNQEVGYAIAVDSLGSAYVTGYTASNNFPTVTPYQTYQNGEAFVTKLSPIGNALIYSTYLGGSVGQEAASAIAVDASGSAYVAGYTYSTNFPTLSAYQATFQGGTADAFVTKLVPAGNTLAYSTYLGGAATDTANAIAVDTTGSVYVGGLTESVNFPTQSPFQTHQGGFDGFVTKLTPAGNALAYSTYIGGSMDDTVSGIAVDAFGAAYVTGATYSANFPTQTPYQTDQSEEDAFVAKLLPTTGTTPSALGVVPAGGTGFNQSFTFSFSDPNGWQDLGVVNVLISFWLDGRNSCYLAYSRPLGVLYLVNDAGSALLPALTLGSGASTGNSQCTIFGTGSSATGAGNTLTLTLNMSFAAGYGGTKLIYMAARDVAENNSGWQRLGVWTVPGGPATTPWVVGQNPQRGTGAGPSTFTFQFADTDGWQDLGVVNVLVNDWLDGRNACYIAYSRPLGVLYLVSDSGTTLSELALGSANTVSNSQCTIFGTGSSAGGSGTTLTLMLNMSFKSAFAGNRAFYLAARDVAEHNSGWQALGTWTVP